MIIYLSIASILTYHNHGSSSVFATNASTQAQNEQQLRVIFFRMMFHRKSKSYRTLKAQLAVLEDDVRKSRVAVESITTRPILQATCRQNIERIKNELEACIKNINHEMTKKKVLEELVDDLKGRLKKYESIKKTEAEVKQVKKDKQITQIQMKIGQILKRHNQQIAKINHLKEEASSRRSQRVVFSNLFRKIQKEVTHYQQVYKQQLLQSEEARKRLEELNPKNEKYSLSRETSFNNRSVTNIVNQNYQYSDEDSRTNTYTYTMFVQNEKSDKYGSKIDTKFHSIRSSKHKQKDHHRTFVRQQKLLYTKELLRKISEVGAQVENIKIHAQRQDFDQLMQHYSTLEQENDQLIAEINICNEEILSLEEEKKKVIKNEKAEEFSQQEEQEINPFLLLGFKIKQFTIDSSREHLSNLTALFDQIAQIFKFNLSKNEANTLDHQSLKLLDEKICLLAQKQHFPSEPRQKESNVYSDSIVGCILDKMQKYTTCEKIFDEKLLKQQYYKEIGTRKQIRSRKLIMK